MSGSNAVSSVFLLLSSTSPLNVRLLQPCVYTAGRASLVRHQRPYASVTFASTRWT